MQSRTVSAVKGLDNELRIGDVSEVHSVLLDNAYANHFGTLKSVGLCGNVRTVFGSRHRYQAALRSTGRAVVIYR